MLKQRQLFNNNFFEVIFIVCLIFGLWTVSVGWGNTILDSFGFRQTQTAISAFYLLKGGPFLAYETPVLGFPWSIPFEFPLYQYIVAILAKTFNMPLDQAGRAVSVSFFYMSLVPFYSILRSLNISPQHRWIFLSLFVANPFYLFWARTFMIESLALFLSLSYLAIVIFYFSKDNYISRKLALILLGAGSLLGILAAMTKVTTFVGFLLASSFFTLWIWFNKLKNFNEPKKEEGKYALTFYSFVAPLIGLAVLPLVFAIIWSHFSEAQRLMNPMAGTYLSSDSLKEWTFGWLYQKINIQNWSIILKRLASENWGSHSSNKLFLIASLVLFMTGSRKSLSAICAILFLLPMVIFFNVHLVHNYYQVANCIFLIAAIGFAITGLIEKKGLRKKIGYVLFGVFLIAQMHAYFIAFYPVAKTNQVQLLLTAEAVKNLTEPDDILIVYGFDWSSELPYYSQRRTLMHPLWVGLDVWKRSLEEISGYRVGATVVCGNERANLDDVSKMAHSFDQSQLVYSDILCDVYASN